MTEDDVSANIITESTDIYGLFETENCVNGCSYITGFSYDPKILEKFIDDNPLDFDEEKKTYINVEIKKVAIYYIQQCSNGKIFLYETKKINMSFKNKIYGFNSTIINNNGLQSIQALLVVCSTFDVDSEEYCKLLEKIKEKKVFEHGISLNSIDFDVYYDESIMNA